MGRIVLAAGMLMASLVDGTSAQTDTHTQDPANLLMQLHSKNRPWISLPGPSLRSLNYTYHLGNNSRSVRIVTGLSEVPASFWQGATLTTGLHWLLTRPERFDIELLTRVASAGVDPVLQLRARVRDGGSVSIVAGNGIADSWRGYFSHGTRQVTVDLDPQTHLPLREVTDGSEIQYLEWQEVQQGQWVPQQIDVIHRETHYRMHFAWQEDCVWLLTHAESLRDEQVTEIARVTDVHVNDQSLIDELTAAADIQVQGRSVLKEMLDHNRRWLQSEPSFDSLQYAFHMPWPNVTEECVIQRDGPTVFEVSQTAPGTMGPPVGERKILLANGQYGTSSRGDHFAPVLTEKRERNRPLHAEQLPRYALIGCQLDLPLFELPRVLGDTRVEIHEGEWDETPSHVVTMTVPGSYLGCGTMLGFSSWSYVHHLSPAYEVLYIDRRRNVPIHETFVSSRDNRRFEIDFRRYVEVEDGQWVPMRIDVVSEDHFTCRYDFQLIEGRHWLLKKVVSWFDPRDKSRGIVRDVRVNAPAPLADDALRQVQNYRDLFEAKPVNGPTVDATTFEFELGGPQRLGLVEVRFTLNRAGELVVSCTATDDAATDAGQAISLLLLNDEDRLLGAAQATFLEQAGQQVATANFGRSTALANVVRYAISGIGKNPQHASAEIRALRVRPISVESGQLQQWPPIADASGDTRVIDITLRPGENGQSMAAVHFVSQDRLNEFGLDVSVGVFDQQGTLIAGAKHGTLLVKSNIVEDTWEIKLPSSVTDGRMYQVAVGLSRGQTYSAPMGSLWGRFMTQYPIFPIATMLAAHDPGCWRAGLEELERQIREEVLGRGLLDSVRDWKEQIAEHRTHHDKLTPHVERLLHIVGQTEEPELIAAAIRLLGLSGDERAVEPIRGHVNDNDPGVQDVAAIALGMLGQGEGLARIESVLVQEVPGVKSDPAAYRRYRTRGDDSLIALVALRSDESITVARRLLLKSIEAVESVPHDSGGYSLQGSHIPNTLALLLGCFTDPRYVDVLTEALTRIEELQPAGGRYSHEVFLTSLHEYGPAAREYLARRVEAGDFSALPGRDPFFVSAVHEALQRADINVWAIGSAIRYLWNAGTPEAVEVLKELYAQELPVGDGRERVRMYLIEALAYHGDNRGLPEAFQRLVELARPGEPPADDRERRTWERRLDDDREAALDVFGRASTDAVFALLEPHAATDRPDIRLAVLLVLEGQRQLPKAFRTIVETWAGSSEETAVTIEAKTLLSRHN